MDVLQHNHPASRHFQALDARRLWAKSRHLANSCVLSLDDYRTIIDERELRFYGNSRNNVLKLARHLIPGLFLRLGQTFDRRIEKSEFGFPLRVAGSDGH